MMYMLEPDSSPLLKLIRKLDEANPNFHHWWEDELYPLSKTYVEIIIKRPVVNKNTGEEDDV